MSGRSSFIRLGWPKGRARRTSRSGVGRVALLALCAACLAAQAISGLVATEIKGVSRDATGRADQGGALGLGHAVEPAEVGNLQPGGARAFWLPHGHARRRRVLGGGWPRPRLGQVFCEWRGRVRPQEDAAFLGGGVLRRGARCAGGALGGGAVLRRKDSVFSLSERKLLWFWLGASLISLLLAYGRFAPFLPGGLCAALLLHDSQSRSSSFACSLLPRWCCSLTGLTAYGAGTCSRRDQVPRPTGPG